MTVKEIVIDYLKKNGFDGLCSEACGCGIDDSIPCGEGFEDCEPAYAHTFEDCKKCCKFDNCVPDVAVMYCKRRPKESDS